MHEHTENVAPIMFYSLSPINWNRLPRMDASCSPPFRNLMNSRIDSWGLHTRACKYNLSALETYFECEGVKPTNLNFT